MSRLKEGPEFPTKAKLRELGPVFMNRYKPGDIKRALERTAKWFEAHPERWWQGGGYTDIKMRHSDIVDRFSVELHNHSRADRKARTVGYMVDRGRAHGLLAELAQRLYLAKPDHTFGTDLRYGHVTTINDYRMTDAVELVVFLRELAEVVDD